MINFNSNTSLSNLEKLIDLEITSLNSFLDVQKGFSTQILTFLKGFIGNVEVNSIFSEKINKYMSDSSKYLTKINSNISLYNSLLEKCNSIKSHLSSDDYVKEIENYNKQLEKSSTTILKNNAEIETFIFSTTYLDISEYISTDDTTSKIKTDEEVKDDKKISIEDSASLGLTEDTLKISEIDGVVTLPYKVADLKKIMEENPDLCSTYSDVILAKYTIPLKNYKFSAISRFKEAYKLVREREHGKRREALSLATELFSNYNLHPAIITACKNLNELDVYLSCLEFDELNDFHFFKVVYEGLPVVKKGKHGAEITAS